MIRTGFRGVGPQIQGGRQRAICVRSKGDPSTQVRCLRRAFNQFVYSKRRQLIRPLLPQRARSVILDVPTTCRSSLLRARDSVTGRLMGSLLLLPHPPPKSTRTGNKQERGRGGQGRPAAADAVSPPRALPPREIPLRHSTLRRAGPHCSPPDDPVRTGCRARLWRLVLTPAALADVLELGAEPLAPRRLSATARASWFGRFQIRVPR
jgi:hypothetical protein